MHQLAAISRSELVSEGVGSLGTRYKTAFEHILHLELLVSVTLLTWPLEDGLKCSYQPT